MEHFLVVGKVERRLAEPPLVHTSPDHPLEERQRLLTRLFTVADEVIVYEELHLLRDVKL